MTHITSPLLPTLPKSDQIKEKKKATTLSHMNSPKNRDNTLPLRYKQDTPSQQIHFVSILSFHKHADQSS